MTIQTKLTTIVLINLVIFSLALLSYFNVSIFFKQLEQENEYLYTLLLDIKDIRIEAQQILSSEELRTDWNHFVEKYNELNSKIIETDNLNKIKKMDKDIEEAIINIINLESFNKSLFTNLQGYIADLLEHSNTVVRSTPTIENENRQLYSTDRSKNAAIMFYSYRIREEFIYFEYVLEYKESIIKENTKIITKEIEKNESQIRLITIVTCILIIIISLTLSLKFSRRISKDISQIMSNVDNMITENRAIRVDVNRNDEIGVLSKYITEIFNSYLDVQKKLRTSEKMMSLGKMLKGISHEINTPLGICISSTSHLSKLATELIDNTTRADISKKELLSKCEDIKMCSELIENNIHKTSNLIETLKTSTTETLNGETEKINIKTMVSELKMQIANRYKDVLLKCTHDNNLTIPGSETILKQILMELVDNSINHSSTLDNVVLELDIYRDETIHITYSDNGGGIDSKVVDNIFDPFFTTKRGDSKRFGLGLYKVFNLVTHSLNGNIKYDFIDDSRKGFIIDLPT